MSEGKIKRFFWAIVVSLVLQLMMLLALLISQHNISGPESEYNLFVALQQNFK